MSSNFFRAEKEFETVETLEDEEDTLIQKTYSSFEFDGETYHVTIWKPIHRTPRALLFLCHGLGDYISWVYDKAVAVLVKKGFLIFGHDHLGHGRTTGKRVQLKTSIEKDFVDPVIKHCSQRKSLYPKDIPLVISGHSLGGFIAANAIIKRPDLFDFCILTGPYVSPSPEMDTKFNAFAAKWGSRLFPNLEVFGVDVTLLTRNEELAKKQLRDPLMWNKGLKLKQAFGILSASREFDTKMTELEIPILIQTGSDDRICPVQFTKKLHDAIRSSDKTLKVYEGARHSLYKELEETQTRLIVDQTHWLEERIQL